MFHHAVNREAETPARRLSKLPVGDPGLPLSGSGDGFVDALEVESAGLALSKCEV